jgi:hypothetical protein
MAWLLNLTFLQFFCNHDFIASNSDMVSGDSKNFVLGPPSFFGARDIIFERFKGKISLPEYINKLQ